MLPFAVEPHPTRLAFAHYHTQFPLSFDGKPAAEDYYSRQYLTIGGESGKHSAYGGFLRDRPLPSPNLGPNWSPLADMRTEVQQAKAAGLHLILDLLSISATNNHVKRQHWLLEAASETDVKVMLQPDMFVIANQPLTSVAAHIARLAKYRAAFRLDDGRLVVSPFKGEAWTPAKWQQFIDEMSRVHGETVALVPCLVNWPGLLDDYAPVSYGLSVWGDRTHTSGTRMAGAGQQTHALGELWMAPVAVQDVRPYQGKFWESAGLETLRVTAQAAIDSQAEWVIVPTWNDYGENSHVAPSANHGEALLTVLAYWLHLWRHGTPPRVTREFSVETRRAHRTATLPTSQTTLAALQGGVALDQVETLRFGLDQKMTRTTTPLPDTARPAVQDLTYHASLTVVDDPQAERIAELEVEVARLSGALASLQVDHNVAVQVRDEYASRLRNAHAITDIGG